MLQLFNDAYNLISDFNKGHKEQEVHLQPEFGNWMVEAVPSVPYGDISDPV